MKIKIFASLLIIVFLACTTTQARQPDEFLIRNYTMTIAVECLNTALAIMEGMPGVATNSHINVSAGFGSMDRRVGNRELEISLQILQSMGSVTHSSSSSQNVFSTITDLRSQLEVRSNEYNRLMALLHEVESIQNFNRVENRLIQVIFDMEHLQGSLNHFNFETGTSRIHVSLFLETEDEVIEPVGALARIGNAFTTSAASTLTVFQGILIAIVYISIPLIFFALIVICVITLVLKANRKRKKGGELIETNKEINSDQ